jgi:hypothetical protein
MADYSEEYNEKLAEELTGLPQDSDAIEIDRYERRLEAHDRVRDD